ncbi:Ribosomal lysine N-methyltransferase set10 [Smittium mucronatum]|uniref:Ribosomal lysine N-methyltransferase set10 n=1 Tax=Smittium mucronatum TaxID=133383 RepID=A0A1R0GRK4_9FUNG|nr:Ribosomal lysine N-methyltransferase set10 [Smittium mucronatum]
MKENSFWWPYLDILPIRFSSTNNFTQEEFDLLKGTPLEFSAIERKKDLQQLYEEFIFELKKKNLDLSVYTWDNFIWAYSVFESRAFIKDLIDPNPDIPNSEILIPYLDFANHKPKQPVCWEFKNKFVNFTNDLVLLQSGQEIFNNYGPKSNEECRPTHI